MHAVGPGHLQVFSDPQPRYAGFTGDFTYEGTFARAEAQAKKIKKRPHALNGIGAAAGLALGNVTYYFTGWTSTPQLLIMTGCLVKAYHGQPRWPASVNPAHFPARGGIPYWIS